MPLHHTVQLSQLRVRSITAGLDDLTSLNVTPMSEADHSISLLVERVGQPSRVVALPVLHLLALARLEPESPLRVHEYLPPPEPALTPLHVPGNRGKTFDPAKDEVRTNATLDAVKAYLSDGQWHTLFQIRQGVYVRSNCSSTEAGISARLRDLRKPEYGGHTIERERVPETSGLWRYRLVVR